MIPLLPVQFMKEQKKFIKFGNRETYERKKGMINYNGEWVPEGSKDFPWEKMPWE